MAKLNGYLTPVLLTLIIALITISIFVVDNASTKASDNAEDIVNIKVSNSRTETILEGMAEDLSTIKKALLDR